MTWALKWSTVFANSEPNSKKSRLGQLAPPVCKNGDRPEPERWQEKSSLDSKFNDVCGGAGHRELNEWQVSKLWCFFAIPNRSNHSGLCWLKFFCAKLRENDPE